MKQNTFTKIKKGLALVVALIRLREPKKEELKHSPKKGSITFRIPSRLRYTVKPKPSIFRKGRGIVGKGKRWHFIHMMFKIKLFIPLMLILEKRLGKYMVKKKSDIPKKNCNRNLLILWDAVEKTHRLWINNYLHPVNKPKNNSKHMRQQLKYKGVKIINFCRNLAMTVDLEDTAYREWTNIFTHVLNELMTKAYHPGVQYVHPLYISKFDYDIPYFRLWGDYEHYSKGVVMAVLDKATENEPHKLLIRNKFVKVLDNEDEKRR